MARTGHLELCVKTQAFNDALLPHRGRFIDYGIHWDSGPADEITETKAVRQRCPDMPW